MERCPNCGAPARPGAKFCTTCGYRLPVAVPVTSSDSGDSSPTGASSSWPQPPAQQPTQSDAAEQAEAEPSSDSTQSATEDVIVVPVSATDDGGTDESAEMAATETADRAASTDSVLSSSWPSADPASKPSPWATADSTASDKPSGAEVEVEDESDQASQGPVETEVTEETVVVAEPASQYEGWSSAVVEEVAPLTATHGTPIARATALLDELRLLLPALNARAGTDISEAVADELDAALTGAQQPSSERDALRAALNEARDNPRDIQTILGLSQQADAAIALLDDYDKLTDAVQRAINALRPESSRS